MTRKFLDRIFVPLRDLLSRYVRQTSGTILVAFALMAPVLVASMGMALDFAQAYLVQQRLAQALDAAALAAAASSADSATIEQKIQEFFDINYPEEKLGVTFTPVVEIIGNEIHVSGHADYITFFLHLIGIPTVGVDANTTVLREVQGIEVVMVLDNTGSMATNNNIRKLKESARSFVEILFDRTTSPEFVKIGLVPYSNSVRVGRYGLGQKPDGSVYADGEAFVTLAPDVRYTTDHTSDDWYGCVVEHLDDGYELGATPFPNTRGQLWYDAGGNPDGHGWDPRVTNNNPYPDDVLDDYRGPWDPYMYGRVISNGQECDSYSGFSNSRCNACNGTSGRCTTPYCFCWKSDSNDGTNSGCPYANVVPLTSDEDALLEAIGDPNDNNDGMRAHGNTLGNIGMVWGYRVLSPEFPFEEAQPWENYYWKKAVVMMTDGVNTDDSNYSAFWSAQKNGLNTNSYNSKFLETCDALKDNDVIVYTITFTDGASGAKDTYRDCASTDDKYYHVSDPDDLQPLFEQIARELSNLHITQ